MATLEKIRGMGPLLVIVVGLALLAFIVGDFLNNGASFFNRSRENIAHIGKEKIHYNTFNAAVEQLTNVYKIEQGVSDLDEVAMNEVRNSAWQNLVRKTLLEAEAKKIGMTVASAEMTDYLLGSNFHPLIQQRRIFADETGRFSPVAVQNFLKYLQQEPATQDARIQHDQLQSYWDYWVDVVRLSALQEKYFTLIGKSVAANNMEAQFAYDAAKNTADVNYVEQPFYAVSDSLVKVTDADVKAFFNLHKNWYKQDESRTLEYVSFELKPSQKDFEEVNQWINSFAEEFRSTNDIESVVNSNSDISYNDRSVYSQANIPVYLKDFAFGGKTGDVIGPFFHENVYTMARIMDTGINTPDSVRLRHIFIVGENSVQRADSIMDLILGGGDFAVLAKQFSAVSQTANAGGEIGWVTADMYGGLLTKEIVEDAFANRTGDVHSYEMEQGTQIIQAYEKTQPRNKVRLAILERRVVPSNETTAEMYNLARQFAVDSKGKLADFEQVAKEKNYILRSSGDITKATGEIGTVQQSRQIIRWAFENKKGKISEVFDCDNQYVVAALTEANNTGYRLLTAISPSIKQQLIQEKKGELIARQIADKMAQNADINALAAALGVDVKTAPAVNFAAASFGTAGQEPAVIGKVSTLKQGEISSPVIGNLGVYVVQIINQSDSAAAPLNLEFERQQIEMRNAYYLPYMVMQDIMQNTKIEDNRLRFF